MAEQPQRHEVGPDLWLEMVSADQLTEQDVNAQVMKPADFDRLVENIRQRGAPESTPYCARPNDEGPRWIVSGHHRVRAARAAGIKTFAILLDTSAMTRSTMTAKQIAHNALVGESDRDVLARLVASIDEADDLIATGLDASLLPTFDEIAPSAPVPSHRPDWRTVEFVFLPPQLADFEALLAELPSLDLVGAVDLPQYEAFARAVGRYARLRQVKAVGTAVAMLTRIALEALQSAEEPPKESEDA